MENDNQNLDAYEGQSNLTGFFYTFEKSIQKMDDSELFEEISKKYVNLNMDEVGDTVIRKTILELLDNDAYVNELLVKYEMDISDLISTLYRKLSSVFANALFVRKIRNLVANKPYAAKYR